MILNAFKGKDFTGQNIYAGIDTHHKSWMRCFIQSELQPKMALQSVKQIYADRLSQWGQWSKLSDLAHD
jgi:hypothetical protein